MEQDLAKRAADEGIAYFLISFVDLFGVLRAKLVPAAAIAQMQRDGAAFAGFATHLDLTPADPDVFAIPDPDQPHRPALEPQHRLARRGPDHEWQADRPCAAQFAEKADRRGGDKGLPHEDRRRGRVLRHQARRHVDRRRCRHPEQGLLRPIRAAAPLRPHPGDQRRDARPRLGPLSERSRGRQRAVRDELGL